MRASRASFCWQLGDAAWWPGTGAALPLHSAGTTRCGGCPAGAFISIKGNVNRVGTQLAQVSARAAKGSQWVTVNNPGALRVGQYYDTWWQDQSGRFNNLM